MKISYGYTVEENNDPFVALAEESMRVGSLAGRPGRWLVESIPLCMYPSSFRQPKDLIFVNCNSVQYVPIWFPGAGFKRQAKV